MSKDREPRGKSETEDPPAPPEIERRIRLPRVQTTGLVLLGLVVALALFGLFGVARGTASGRGEVLTLSIDYPTRARYLQTLPMRVLVTNHSRRTIDTVIVSFDTAYISGFSDVTFVPSASGAWQVTLVSLEPRDSRRVEVGLRGDRYGLHSGSVSASSVDAIAARATVRTFIFP